MISLSLYVILYTNLNMVLLHCFKSRPKRILHETLQYDHCNELNVCVPSNSQVDAQIPALMMLRGEAFGRWLGLHKVTRWSSHQTTDGNGVLLRSQSNQNSLWTVWGFSEEVAAHKPGSGSSLDHDHANILNLDFQPPERWELFVFYFTQTTVSCNLSRPMQTQTPCHHLPIHIPYF